jgi:uncharacterized protein YoxC
MTGPVPALVLAVTLLVLSFAVIRKLYQELADARREKDLLRDRLEAVLRESRDLIERVTSVRPRE